ncbi:hypothetical protein BM221_006925 [Beauveria bassiana]|uniref:Uncharacterized protein n=1 Tax=Beauveria bassiana TaxID=176275 RepID=A0A2N6NJ17_BEABA|nr:hypothetical protein BM221_006925 [Beauveria bassiana]
MQALAYDETRQQMISFREDVYKDSCERRDESALIAVRDPWSSLVAFAELPGAGPYSKYGGLRLFDSALYHKHIIRCLQKWEQASYIHISIASAPIHSARLCEVVGIKDQQKHRRRRLLPSPSNSYNSELACPPGACDKRGEGDGCRFGHQFRQQYEPFWADLASTELLWISLLFSILGAAALLAKAKLANEPGVLPPFIWASRRGASSPGDTWKGRPGSVEAVLQHAHSRNMQRQDEDRVFWSLYGLAARMAQLQGHHRDPSRLSVPVSAFAGEMRPPHLVHDPVRRAARRAARGPAAHHLREPD